MDLSLDTQEELDGNRSLARQTVRFSAHTALALGTWIGLMLVGYAVNPVGVPQWLILLLSAAVPLGVGFIFTQRRQDPIAVSVWLFGLIWFLIIALWILDMPTGPHQCLACGASEKLTRTFFSFPQPSGLIDDDGPFIGTWPAAALVGYSIGAKLALRKRR